MKLKKEHLIFHVPISGISKAPKKETKPHVSFINLQRLTLGFGHAGLICGSSKPVPILATSALSELWRWINLNLRPLLCLESYCLRRRVADLHITQAAQRW